MKCEIIEEEEEGNPLLYLLKIISNSIMKKIYSILFFFLAIQFYGQIQLKGVVKDSLNSPLELANVIAIDKVGL